jgi:hypothetical protein
MFIVFIDSFWLGRSGASKFICQSFYLASIQKPIQKLQSSVADWPQAVAAAWTRHGSRTLAVAPLVRSCVTSSHHGTLLLLLFLPPSSLSLQAEKPSRHYRPRSGEPAHAHHRTTVHQISPTAPP